MSATRSRRLTQRRASLVTAAVLTALVTACQPAPDTTKTSAPKLGESPAETVTDAVTTVNGSQPAWPSPEQIELVKRRQASFPLQSVVSAVDWYEPLETVPGGQLSEFTIKQAEAATFAAADALVEAQNSHAFLVWKDGVLVHEKYGTDFNQASRYDTASMHKSVLALLVGIAIDEGHIKSVDDSLDTYLGHLAGTTLGAAPLRALLQMSSGITAPERTNDPANPNQQMYLGDDLKAAIGQWPVPNQPFDEFFYSNTNSQYLAWVLEEATGQRYGDFLANTLWQPLGNASARLWLDREGGMPRASCCLQASARDWLRVGLLMLNSGKVGNQQIVSSQWIKAMTTASTTNPNYGFQVWLGNPHQPKRTYSKSTPIFVPAAEPFARKDVVYFDGFGGQRVYIIPSENLVIVRIGKVTFTWDDSKLPNLVISALE